MKLGNQVLSKEQFRKLKPSFKKVISSEISRIVSKGTHHNTAIRDIIAAQDIEQKAHDQYSKGIKHLRQFDFQPKRLTNSELMNLLYDQSSLMSSAIVSTDYDQAQANTDNSQQQERDQLSTSQNQDIYGVHQSLADQIPQDLSAVQNLQYT